MESTLEMKANINNEMDGQHMPLEMHREGLIIMYLVRLQKCTPWIYSWGNNQIIQMEGHSTASTWLIF